MSRSKLLELTRKRKEEIQRNPATEGFWKELCDRIKIGHVVPIISNSIRTNRIFHVDNDENLGPVQYSSETTQADDYTIEEELAMAWAEAIQYPLSENHIIARVAQYNRVRCIDNLNAKKEFLTFLKGLLLTIATTDPEVASNRTKVLKDEQDELNFADIADGLGYPRYNEGQTDPLLTLAELPLPVYVTSGYFDFMERALREKGRNPRTQICLWSDIPAGLENENKDYIFYNYETKAFYTEPGFRLSSGNPVVYHLFGLEDYPQSMVLSEDDYLDFLAKISQHRSESKAGHILPLYIRQALTQSSLLLLGYRLQDWDFRILFRGIINNTLDSLQEFNLAIQLNPKDRKGWLPNHAVKEYLTGYLGRSFTIEWRNNDDFIGKLWAEWQKWR